HWSESVAHFEAVTPDVKVVLRATSAGCDALRRLSRPYGQIEQWSETLDDGRCEGIAAFESFDDAYYELLRIGADVEVVEPASLRTRLAATARALHEGYKKERSVITDD